MTFVADISGINPTDQKLTSHSRTAANAAAVMALTPAFPGEIVLALDTGQRYRGLALAAGAWGTIEDMVSMA